MTTIHNASAKEEAIIKKRLLQSGLAKHMDKIVVINGYVNKYTEKHYHNLFLYGNEKDKFYGMHAYCREKNQSDIIISSIKFISKNPDKRYKFDSMFMHELGHVNHAYRHKYNDFLEPILPKSDMMRDISFEVYADAFKNALIAGEINQKAILKEAKHNMKILIEDFNKIVNSGKKPDYLYQESGFKIIPDESEVKEFERKCIYCKKEIIMRKTSLGWKAYEKDNKKHNCEAIKEMTKHRK